jgi:hypothetical protein
MVVTAGAGTWVDGAYEALDGFEGAASGAGVEAAGGASFTGGGAAGAASVNAKERTTPPIRRIYVHILIGMKKK